MIFSENNSNIAKAFTQAWGNISTPKHNSNVEVLMKSGKTYKFDYTDLTGIFDAIKEMFKENGLAVMQNGYTEQINEKNYACVETMIIHSTGEWVKSNKLMFLAAHSMQDFGGQITYMKRYSLSAMLGLSTDKDDDANGASGNSYEYNKTKQMQNNNNQQSNSSELPKTAEEASKLVFNFGKHNGKNLKNVIESDMQYLQWAAQNNKLPAKFIEGVKLIIGTQNK